MALPLSRVFPSPVDLGYFIVFDYAIFQRANVCLWFDNFTSWSIKAVGSPQSEVPGLFGVLKGEIRFLVQQSTWYFCLLDQEL